MKKFVSSVLKLDACLWLAILFLLLLLVPNVVLCVTESMGWLDCFVNIVMPMGFYLLVVSMFRRTGWAVWAMLPFSILAAFQIVLIFLYGGSIIAVDMFLNVVTTNMSEACELLRNLGRAIFTVVVLYLPPLVWATVSLVRHKEILSGSRRMLRRSGFFLFSVGTVVACVHSVSDSRFSISADVFPVNVLNNIRIAVIRTIDVNNYEETSADFVSGARSVHDDKDEVYVMIIGETSRACNWQLDGYKRETCPRLSKRSNVTFFNRVLSESNTTHKSVPMLLSHITACNFDSIRYVKSIITLFKDAGFKTTFISNQAPNHSYTEFFGCEADDCIYMTDTEGHHAYDEAMLPYVERCLLDTVSHKQLIVLHSYGSHFKYRERYPEETGTFKPDECEDVNYSNRDRLINAYDNTIEYTDKFLDSIMSMIENSRREGAVVYASDHGEDILDDDRMRFLHASPTPTYYQLHVAMLTWVSDSYKQRYPEKLAIMQAHRDISVSSTSSLYNTMLDLGGVDSPYYDKTLSVASDEYVIPCYLYLNDMNDGIPLDECGLKNEDFIILKSIALM